MVNQVILELVEQLEILDNLVRQEFWDLLVPWDPQDFQGQQDQLGFLE